MKIKLLPIICLTVLLGIMQGCSTQVCGCMQIDTQIHINFVDQNGHSLVNPNHPHAMTKRNTDLLFLENGQKKIVDHKFEVVADTADSRYFLNIQPNIIKGQNTSIAYLRFDDSTMDTLKVEYQYGDNLEVVEKVWYNQQLRWDREEGQPRLFKVTRNIEE